MVRNSQRGRLVLIVGPSGVGKDTLIEYARQALAGDANIRFVQRAITRPPSIGEDHTPMDEDRFERAAGQGAFALHWAAHDMRYGLPVIIDQWLAEGNVVIANGSRAMLGEARRRYPAVEIVSITAAPEVLAQRLAGRGRETDEERRDRMARYAAVSTNLGDVTIIDNSGEPEAAAARLIGMIKQLPSNGIK
ncbi:phosphonate metabolism protein/1,5-bisphosphokinase (PRPP-forming) PhnN [Rhizobium laguerreae]|nr:phosphonate metabolism protein/1,5-bisphosphokinase (PRPP-forming) PhnN [Rhizobium laguerreae]TBX97334.1 phosphonate metabolism protein/1,5-bisphosphokinase (PRPP-forming) PhnN [Rhizobium laguerreae]